MQTRARAEETMKAFLAPGKDRLPDGFDPLAEPMDIALRARRQAGTLPEQIGTWQRLQNSAQNREIPQKIVENTRFQQEADMPLQMLDKGGQADILKEISTAPIRITAKAVEAVPVVELPRLSSQQAGELQEHARKLLKFAADAKPGTEAALYLDMELKPYQQYLGEIGQGQIRLKQPDRPSIVLHTHPSGQTFSVEDIRHFLQNPSIEVFGAIGNDGTVYLLSRTENYEVAKVMRYYRQWKSHNPGMFSDPPKVTPEEYVSKLKELLSYVKTCGFTFIESGPGVL